jgi:two-component system OmpR family response regulator
MKSILLVEDDPQLNENIKSALQIEGYDVQSVFDGELAYRLMQRENYDCIILDVNLPIYSGYELAKKFRNINTLTPIIMLTAFGELEDKVKGYTSGADDYLTKPFYMKELALRVQALMNRSRNSDTSRLPEIVFDDIVINDKSKQVTRQQQEITLTPREYQILSTLVNAKGDIVSKNDLTALLWGKHIDTNTNTIEVYINFLRKKLDKPFGKNTIRTKVGYGYYLEKE